MAIGARGRASSRPTARNRDGEDRVQLSLAIGIGGYFGLGKRDKADRVVIEWPSGDKDTSLRAGIVHLRRIEIHQRPRRLLNCAREPFQAGDNGNRSGSGSRMPLSHFDPLVCGMVRGPFRTSDGAAGRRVARNACRPQCSDFSPDRGREDASCISHLPRQAGSGRAGKYSCRRDSLSMSRP